MPYADKEQQSKAQRASYERTKERRLEKQRQRRLDQREFIDATKRDIPCLDCGVVYPPHVMDYDHVRGDKKYSLGRLARICVSYDTILEEIAKCDLVCSNCHRIRTHERGED